MPLSDSEFPLFSAARLSRLSHALVRIAHRVESPVVLQERAHRIVMQAYEQGMQDTIELVKDELRTREDARGKARSWI